MRDDIPPINELKQILHSFSNNHSHNNHLIKGCETVLFPGELSEENMKKPGNCLENEKNINHFITLSDTPITAYRKETLCLGEC